MTFNSLRSVESWTVRCLGTSYIILLSLSAADGRVQRGTYADPALDIPYTMPNVPTVLTFLLALGTGINLTSAAAPAHAGFHVQYPWSSRGANLPSRPELDEFHPFCRKFLLSVSSSSDSPVLSWSNTQPKGRSCTTPKPTPAALARSFPSQAILGTLSRLFTLGTECRRRGTTSLMSFCKTYPSSPLGRYASMSRSHLRLNSTRWESCILRPRTRRRARCNIL